MLYENYRFTSPTPITLSCIARKLGGSDQELSMNEFMKRLEKNNSSHFNKLETFLAMANSGVYEVLNVSASNGGMGWPFSVWIISSHDMCWATKMVGRNAPFEFLSEDSLYATIYMKVEGMESPVPIDLSSLTRL